MLFKRIKSDFENDKMSSLIFKQSIPQVIAQLTLLLYTIIDRIYIGHITDVGQDALSGLGITFPIISLISAFTMLFGQGGSVLFSLELGKRNYEKAKDYLSNAFILLLSSSIIMTAVSYLFMNKILLFLGASDNTLKYAYDYMMIYSIGIILQMIQSGLSVFVVALGFPIKSMIATLSGAIINLILDPIFIFKFNLGIKGAAIATILSLLFPFVYILISITSKNNIVYLSFNKIKFSIKDSLKIMSIGATNFIVELTNSLTVTCYNKSLKYYGSDLYVGIYTIINSVRSIMGVAVSGISSGVSPIISFNYSAKHYKRVKSAIKLSFLYMGLYTLIAWGLVVLFPSFFCGLFTDKEYFISLSTPYLHTFFMAYIFMAFQFIGQTTFMATGNTKKAITFSLFRKVILVIPLIIILPLIMEDKINAIFLSEPISNVVGGLLCFITMYLTFYRRLKSEN